MPDQKSATVPAPVVQKPSEVGRYVIVHSPQVERDTMLLDTVTGRTWQLQTLTYLVSDPLAWEPVPQLNTLEDREAIATLNGRKASH
jgi:hypothetical protein